jgi:acyl-CoA hydrolase
MTLAFETLPSVYSHVAPAGQIERTAQALERNGIHTLVVENAEEARELFLELVPEGAQVHQGSSVTLAATGIIDEIERFGRYEAIRPRIHSLDRATQGDEIRKLSASPDYMVGSVQAVTEDGKVLVASGSGSQLGPYVSGAGKVIWVVGAQKLVKNLDEAYQRLEQYVLPLEDQRARQAYGMGSNPNKVLIFNKERPGRITMILVRENIGF